MLYDIQRKFYRNQKNREKALLKDNNRSSVETHALLILNEGVLVKKATLIESGIPDSVILKLLRDNAIATPARGIYKIAGDVRHYDYTTEAVVCALLQKDGVICLKSAAERYNLINDFPGFDLDVAIKRNTKKAAPEQGLILHHWGDESLAEANGIETVKMSGVNVRITSRERTVVDLYRYRNKIADGARLATEALTTLMTSGMDTDELLRLATMFHVENVIKGQMDGFGASFRM